MNTASKPVEAIVLTVVKTTKPELKITPFTPIGRAAKQMGISRQTLWKYCRFYGISGYLTDNQIKLFFLLHIYLTNAIGKDKNKISFQFAVEEQRLQQLFEDLKIFEPLQKIKPELTKFIEEIDANGYND